MNGNAVTIALDDDREQYGTGELLMGEFRIDLADPKQATAVELSVIWYTEGKGDEDLAVHFFDRLELDHASYLELRRPRRFSISLPNSPLSYDGLIIKIRWCVRVRVFLGWGKDIVAQKFFRLGNVPPAQIEEPPLPEPVVMHDRKAQGEE